MVETVGASPWQWVLVSDDILALEPGGRLPLEFNWPSDGKSFLRQTDIDALAATLNTLPDKKFTVEGKRSSAPKEGQFLGAVITRVS